MNNSWLTFLDWFFLTFHTLFTLFNILGWIWKKTRKIHLFTMLATLFSWAFLGIWYGFGYCFCTDWHWQVRELLGKPVETPSYIAFLAEEISGIRFAPEVVDSVVLAVFCACLALSMWLNVRAILARRRCQ
ncbi:MAG: DUF2784 domain-containing protein [Bacteroidetes bacterium]|nr:DUF2784 domain-containing protein [Bacteroidota bacterium]